MMRQGNRYGLIGERLGHSHSPKVHGLLDDRYPYELIPLAPEQVGPFLEAGDFDGLNVTIPYKQTVIPYCAQLGEMARRIGSVNTLVKRADGSLFGDNTDAYGFSEMAWQAGISFAGQKALVLGSGGTSLTARAVIEGAGGEVVVVSRQGEDNYQNLERHGDATLVVNTTPVGMWPHTDAAPVDLRLFSNLRGVLDVVYNPLRTRLLLQAEELRVPHGGGLSMLVFQAARARELFTGEAIPDARAQSAYATLRKELTNLVLVGMPGCGKTTLGKALATRLGRPMADMDQEIEKECGCRIAQLFEREGEAGFRAREAEQIARYGREGGRVLVTGGGAVENPQNRENLRLNGFVVHLTRSLELLPLEGRPLSKDREALQALWQRRAPLYAACADARVSNDTTISACADQIAEVFHEAFCH